MACVMQHASRAPPKYPAMAYSTIGSASTAGSNPNGGFVHTVCNSLTRHERSIFLPEHALCRVVLRAQSCRIHRDRLAV
jgi:hypothetical protein